MSLESRLLFLGSSYRVILRDVEIVCDFTIGSHRVTSPENTDMLWKPHLLTEHSEYCSSSIFWRGSPFL